MKMKLRMMYVYNIDIDGYLGITLKTLPRIIEISNWGWNSYERNLDAILPIIGTTKANRFLN